MGKKIAVVGSGISGVATAYYLSKMGYKPEILEAESESGGRIKSLRLGERMIDIGGKNIGKKYSFFRSFAEDIGGYSYEFFGINSSVIQNNELKTIDSQKRMGTMLNLVQLVGVKSFLKFARLALIVKRKEENGFLGSEYFNQLSKKLDKFAVSEYFSPNFNENFLRPITIRMNGSEPQEYYMGNLGTNIRMITDTFDQLECGMHNLLNDFEKRILIKHNHRATGVILEGEKVIGVDVEHLNETKTLLYDGVMLATPALATSKIINGMDSKLSQILSGVTYNPVTIAIAMYDRNIFTSKIRAIVFDKNYALSNAGCYGINDLNIIRYTLSGKEAQKWITAETDPNQVVEYAEETLNQYVTVSKDWRTDFVYKHIPHGLCAYSRYHHKRLEQLKDCLGEYQGLGLSGDYLKGASLEACFRAAKESVIAFNNKFHKYNFSKPAPIIY